MAPSLVEKAETHVLIRLFLLLFLLSWLLLLSGSCGTTSATTWNRSQLGRTVRDKLHSCQPIITYRPCRSTYGVKVLALKFGDELLQAFLVGVNTNGRKDTLDILSGWARVAGKAE